MRTVKFRGLRKDKLSADFIIGSLIVEPNGSYWIDWFEDGVRRTTEVIPETVGQFTGLTDKNGCEIYDGDVISYYGNKQGKKIGYSNDGRLVWKDNYGDFTINVIEIHDPLQMEVIGNIHQK